MLLLTSTLREKVFISAQHPDSANPLLFLSLHLKLNLKKYKSVGSIWEEEKREGTNDFQHSVVVLPGDTFVFNGPVDASALSGLQRQFLQLPTVQKKIFKSCKAPV